MPPLTWTARRCKTTRFGDIDLAVVERSGSSPLGAYELGQLERALAEGLGGEAPPLDLRRMTPDQYLWVHEVSGTGRLLYEADRSSRVALEVEAAGATSIRNGFGSATAGGNWRPMGETDLDALLGALDGYVTTLERYGREVAYDRLIASEDEQNKVLFGLHRAIQTEASTTALNAGLRRGGRELPGTRASSRLSPCARESAE